MENGQNLFYSMIKRLYLSFICLKSRKSLHFPSAKRQICTPFVYEDIERKLHSISLL
jgi:hypothetical protein